jgi:integrase
MATGTTLGQVLSDMPTGVFVTLQKVLPMGSLQARKQASGAVGFYWRYSIGPKSERVAIGLYDSSSPPKSLKPTAKGFSIVAAVQKAQVLAAEHHQHREAGGRPALVAAKRAARDAEDLAKEHAAKFTLGNLLDDYCEHLQALGRDAHRNARSIFKVHVKEPWPALAAKPAKDITPDEFADMMRRVFEAGKGRTANKLRAYARAAYQAAKAAKTNATIPLKFKGYGITVNPVAETAADETANKPAKRPLTAQEMRTYWEAIRDLSGFKGAVLRLHVLTGAQRIEQLARLRTADIGADAITIFDGKGRPGRPPRAHALPLTNAAALALKECEASGKFALSTDKGETHIAGTTLSGWAVEAAAGKIEAFQAKRLRSGVETLLASAGISREVRGRLQSHGIAGVQARHYDGHDYMAEKRQALETLQRLLDQKDGSKVVPIKAP